MNNNLDLLKVQSYSTALSSKLCNGYFTSVNSISGEQILSFCSVHQINIYIVKALFSEWKQELKKLESPYFNYQAEEVKEALHTFMNTLSKNIAVDKKAFIPLVQKAVYDTLLICLSPEQYLEEEFSSEDVFTKEEILEKLKYTKVKSGLSDLLIQHMSSSSIETISGEDAKQVILNLPDSTQDACKQTLEDINKLLAFEVKDFTMSSFSPESTNANKPFGEEEVEKPVKNAVSATAATPKIGAPSKSNEQQLTINDSLKTNTETSISDRFSKSKIEDLKSSIPLNLKFLFINILFDGNSVDYAHALSQVELAENIDDAKTVLTKNYATQYKWAEHTEEKEEFLKIIERRFY